ncbi:MAG: iron transporter [Brevundimonas sp.]|uniref:Nramp family divalent metal transporter n=1 Tax=Brevundimonas albigilva TaxID=1312364 RepID=A0ABY4SK35_9CAUL|nr:MULTISPECIES: Nramp family divalent metal transporter [Brevundimonas]PZU54661.1 MAG: iron transporter [Brevundimonas sp.]URI14385.1 Nramp family divalent metal transporter [Brevundimonas albigilva]
MSRPENEPQAPAARWSLIGPGIVVAATGVGAGDLVATLIAGSRFGYALLWAAVAGTVIKIALAEGVGRWTLASGRTIFDGWSSLGGGWFGGRLNWAGLYFGLYVVVWGFVYGAAAMTAAALPLAALFGGDLKAWGVASGVAGLGLVWMGGYGLFEKVMTALVGVMFVTVVGLAVIVAPDLPALATGLWPRLPEGSVFYTLGLIGGVGGTITMAAYGYWANAKGWRGPGWMRVMRLDNGVAYVVTGVFVIAMMIVGAELLHSAGIALSSGDRGLLDLDQVLRDRFGRPISILFLVGFWAATFSSLIGVWQGVSLMFADFYGHVAGRSRGLEHGIQGDGPVERTWPFRAYALWLTFPPIVLLFMDRPFGLIVAYGVLGSLFMPFLAGTLIWLLNSDRTPRAWRNGWLSNLLLGAAALLFAALAGNELVGLIRP